MKEFLLHNLSLKILSVVLALILWIFVLGEKSIEYSFVVPLELTNLPSNLVIVSDVTGSIGLRVAGPRPLVSLLKPEKLSVSLDLKEAEPGKTSFLITENNIAMPRGVKLIRINPSMIDLEIDPLIKKAVKVVPKISGELDSGFQLLNGTPKVRPSSVEVSLARRHGGNIEELYTQPVSLNGLSSNLSQEVLLDVSDKRIEGVKPKSVTVELNIQEVQVEKRFNAVPIQALNMEKGKTFQLKPEKAQVQVAGGNRMVSELNEADLALSVNLSGLKPGRHKVELNALLPKGVRVLSLEPKIITVIISPGES